MTKTSFDKPRWRRSILCFLLLCCCFGGDLIVAAPQNNPSRITDASQPLREEFNFDIKDFKMDHQGEVQTLNIKVSLLYVNGVSDKAYPDFRVIAGEVEGYLNKYPNKTDYWEVLNKKLTALILDHYPVISRVTSEIKVSPSAGVPYLRGSIVTRLRRKKDQRVIEAAR